MARNRKANPNQQRLLDTASPLFEINPSRLKTYQDCPRKFKFRYVDQRPERRSSPAAALGRSVHQALCDFFAKPAPSRTKQELMACLRHAWDSAGYPSAVDARKAFLRAQDMLSRFYESADPAEARVFALESKFTTNREGLLIWGRIDRLDTHQDGYVVIDYKTGRQPPLQSAHDCVNNSTPTMLYAAAVAGQLGARVKRIDVHYLADGATTVVDLDELNWSSIVEGAIAIRDDENFEPVTGTACRWCDFIDVCPQGSAAVGHVRSITRRWPTRY